MEGTEKDIFEGWEEPVESEDFFGTLEKPDTTKVDKEEGQEDPKEDSADETAVDPMKAAAEEEDAAEDDFSFETPGEDLEGGEDGNVDPKGGKATKKDKFVSTGISTVEYLKSKGLIDYELEDGEELTEETASYILEDEREKGIEAGIADVLSNAPADLKELTQYVLKGGNMYDYLKETAPSTSGLTLGMDLTDEKNAEAVARYSLEADGFEKGYIDTQIESFKESGALAKFAEVKYNKWSKEESSRSAEMIKRQEEAKIRDKHNLRKSKSEISNYLTDNRNLSGFKITAKDKREMPSYMAEKTIKMPNGAMVTEMHRDIYNVLGDPKKAPLLAKILRSDFDFKNLEVIAETKIASETKKNVRRQGKKPLSNSTGSSQKQKSLEDYYN